MKVSRVSMIGDTDVVYMNQAIEQQTITAIAASIHQSTHASSWALAPHAGTQTSTIILIIVARPIGKQAKKRDCWGCRSILTQSSG